MDTRTITRKRAPNTPTRIVWVALIVEGTREMKFRIMPEELINQVMKSSKIHIVIDNESKIITEIWWTLKTNTSRWELKIHPRFILYCVFDQYL
jgi:hypothetical protein